MSATRVWFCKLWLCALLKLVYNLNSVLMKTMSLIKFLQCIFTLWRSPSDRNPKVQGPMTSTSVAANIPSKVLVHTFGSEEFCLVPLPQPDRLFPITHSILPYADSSTSATKYIIFDMPATGSRFDLYVSNPEDAGKTSTVVAEGQAARIGMRSACRLPCDNMGWWYSGVKRLFSKVYRVLRVGPRVAQRTVFGILVLVN